MIPVQRIDAVRVTTVSALLGSRRVIFKPQISVMFVIQLKDGRQWITTAMIPRGTTLETMLEIPRAAIAMETA